MTNTITMTEVKNLVNYTIDNNFKLQEAGKTPIAVSLEADAGIGKTSILEQIAAERGMTCTKISLHEMDEAGDLIGFPQIEYECQIARLVKDKEGNTKRTILPGTVWMNAKQIEATDKALCRQTGKTRMGYAKPAWVPEYNENGVMVILDDYVRAIPQLLQSCMELILTQKYTSWSLPKKTSIFLTNNPDNGANNVSSLDEAQRSRFMNFSIEWSQDAWAAWAEKAEVDGRCINFVLSYANELFKADEEGNRICNPRSFVMFANMISGIDNWDEPQNLNFITSVAKGCFADGSGRFSQMFSAFIRNKLHLLIQPKDMLLGGWDRVSKQMHDALYDSNGQFRADISSLFERRFVNYVNAWLDSKEKTPISIVVNRILDFLDYEQQTGSKLFTKDLLYHMVKQLTSEHKNQTNKLLFEPRIAQLIA